MAVNRFSRQRNYAKFTPESLEKMSIVPGNYNKLYQERETVKGAMKELGLNPSPFHKEYAQNLNDKWSQRIQEDTKAFMKNGFSDPETRLRLEQLVSEYGTLMKNDVQAINNWNLTFQQNLEDYDKKMEDAENDEHRSWIEAQKNQYYQKASMSPLKRNDRYILPPNSSYVGWRDYTTEIMDLFEEADVLKNFSSESGLLDNAVINSNGLSVGYVETQQRALDAGYELAQMYINKPGVREFFLKMEELYGLESGVTLVKDRVTGQVTGQRLTVYEQDKNGNTVLNTNTVLGQALVAGIKSKFGISLSPKFLKGSGSGYGGSGYGSLGGSLPEMPVVNTSVTNDGETFEYNAFSQINKQIEITQLEMNMLKEQYSTDSSDFVGNVSELYNLNFKTQGEDLEQFNIILANDLASVAKIQDPVMKITTIEKILKDNGISSADARIAAREIANNVTLSNQMLQISSEQESLNLIQETYDAANSVRNNMVKKIESTWKPVNLRELRGIPGALDGKFNSFSDLESYWQNGINQSLLEFKSLYENGMSASVQQNLFKIDPSQVTPEQLDKDLALLNEELNNIPYSLDYTKDNYNAQLIKKFQTLNSKLNVLNIEPDRYALTQALKTVRDEFSDAFDWAFNDGGISENYTVVANRLYNKAVYATMAVSENTQIIDQMSDSYAMQQMIITTQDYGTESRFTKNINDFTSSVLEHLSPAISNTPTMSGLTFYQKLEEMGVDVGDSALDISNANINIGMHTDIETGELVPTIVIGGNVSYNAKKDGKPVTQKVSIPNIHVDMRAYPQLYDRLDDHYAKMWISTNSRKDVTDADTKASGYLNQFVGRDIIKDNELVTSRFLNVPNKPNERMTIYFNKPGGASGLAELKPIEFVTRYDANTKKYFWAEVSGGIFGGYGGTPSQRLDVLYQYVGRKLFEQTFL